MANPTRDQILQTDTNTSQFDAGAAILLVQDPNNYSITGYGGTAFPGSIDDIINLSGGSQGTANSTNGWRNVGFTGPLTWNRSPKETDLGAEQAFPVLTVVDQWEHQITGILVETSEANLSSVMIGDPAGWQAGSGSGTQKYLGLGSPSAVTYQRVAIVHPTPAGALYAVVFAKVRIKLGQPVKYERTARVEYNMSAMAYPDSRIASVHHRVARIYHTADAFLL